MRDRAFDLLVLRHAASAAPAGHAIGQWNVPLSGAGRTALAARIERWPDPMPTRIVSSDLARARETAHAIAQRFGLPVVEDPGWREIGLGAWEGRRWGDIERDDGEHLAAWYADWRAVAPPGGESWPTLIARVRAAFERLAAAAQTGDKILLVTHVGAIQAFLVGIAGIPDDRILAWTLPPLAAVRAKVKPGTEIRTEWAVDISDPARPSGWT